MPISQYDQYFGGKGSANKVMAKLVQQYGASKGRQVFYALIERIKQRMSGKRSPKGKGQKGKGGLRAQMKGKRRRQPPPRPQQQQPDQAVPY